MQIETIEDVLHWTRSLHQFIGTGLRTSEAHSHDERARLLLDYLADHEAALADLIGHYEREGEPQALHTWCAEYVNKQPLSAFSPAGQSYDALNTTDVINAVLNFHQRVIELYRYLHGRVDATSAKELLQQLISLEEHEAMRMAQTSNRWGDL